jgi:hypothetical protein
MKISKILLTLMIFSAAGCGVTDTMNEMNNKMDQMNQNTTRMGDTTTEMDASTDVLVKLSQIMGGNTTVLAQITENLALDARPAFALALRRESLNRMDKTRVMEVKLSEATTFYMCQEFQVWKNYVSDDALRREMLKGQAAGEYFRAIKEWLTSDRSVSPASNENRIQNLYALATTMHTIGEDQALVSKKNHVQPVSMLSIIEESLTALRQIQDGKKSAQGLPVYMTEVINNESVAVYLLRLRFNFLIGMSVANVTNLNLSGTPQCGEGVMSCLSAKLSSMQDLMLKVRMYISKWTPTFADKNVVQMQVYNSFLTEALRTRDILTKLRYGVTMDPLLAGVLGNMQPYNDNGRLLSHELGQEIALYQNQIKALLSTSK